MERVKKGEKYWHIGQWGDILMSYDEGSPIDDWLFQYGNRFATKEEAESTAEKLRAVLKGADVIEWPSEEEISDEMALSFPLHIENYKSYKEGWKRSIEWLKSKIVK